jgi:hypothetical protein
MPNTALSMVDKPSRQNVSKHTMNRNTWLADSAATAHYTCKDDGMFNIKMINTPIKIGNGKMLTATKVGSIRMRMEGPENETQTITLHQVKYVPELWINLFSIPVALQKGFQIGNKGLRLH